MKLKNKKGLIDYPTRKDQQAHLDKEHGGHGKLPYKDSHYFLKLKVTPNYYEKKNENDNSFLKGINDEVEENEKARKVDNKWAILKDGTTLRISEKRIFDLVKPGYKIKCCEPRNSDYDSNGLVIGVSRYSTYGLDTYSITIIDPITFHKKYKNGKKIRQTDFGYLNELVFHKGKIRHLFRANQEFIKILDDSSIFCEKCNRLFKKYRIIESLDHLFYCKNCFIPLWEKGKETPLDKYGFCEVFLDINLGACHVWKFEDKIFCWADFSHGTIPAKTSDEDAHHNMKILRQKLIDEKLGQISKSFDIDIYKSKSKVTQKEHDLLVGETLNVYKEKLWDITNIENKLVVTQLKKIK